MTISRKPYHRVKKFTHFPVPYPGVYRRIVQMCLMIAFADLLERLVFTPSRNAKIALLRRYFATEADPDRGIGLAAMTGELSFTAAKPA